MVTIVQDFFSFIKGKTEQKNYQSNNILWIIVGYLLLFSIVVLHSVIKSLFSKFNIITPVDGSGSPDKWIAESSLFIFVVQVGILAPIMEEFAFRGVLLKKHKLVMFSVVVLLYLIVCKISSVGFYSMTMKSSMIFATVFLIIYIFKDKIIPSIISFTIKNIKWLIYLSAICFALWHYNNFDFSRANGITFIFILSRYFFHGLVFCWLSNRKGLWASLLLHSINNALPVILAIYDHR